MRGVSDFIPQAHHSAVKREQRPPNIGGHLGNILTESTEAHSRTSVPPMMLIRRRTHLNERTQCCHIHCHTIKVCHFQLWRPAQQKKSSSSQPEGIPSRSFR
uniref:Uncharacterized protein n=1 Tax=Percolomonas cosmopolitus TaxID=63605 RepID=A0A7S1KLE4_9EUKA